MANAFIEKRNELVAMKTKLENDRQAEIETKVSEFRASLEASTPKTEINKLGNVISALDEVIAYESIKTEPVEAKAVETVEQQPQHVSVEARPGMHAIVSPR